MKTNNTKRFERAVKDSDKIKYVLNLYVTGSTTKSIQAINNIKTICEKHLKGRYELTIIDLYQKPALAKGEQILAVPTLIKKLPLPLRKLIGTLSDEEKVIFGLDLRRSD